MAAAELFQASVEDRVTLCVASLSFSHIYYTLRKDNTPAECTDKLVKSSALVQIIAVDSNTIRKSLAAGFTDFEDALQSFAAASVPAIEAIITRDPKGFRGSSLRVLTPAEAVTEAL
nr:PIN domain-containing protein [Hymenobacter coccineus]